MTLIPEVTTADVAASISPKSAALVLAIAVMWLIVLAILTLALAPHRTQIRPTKLALTRSRPVGSHWKQSRATGKFEHVDEYRRGLKTAATGEVIASSDGYNSKTSADKRN